METEKTNRILTLSELEILINSNKRIKEMKTILEEAEKRGSPSEIYMGLTNLISALEIHVVVTNIIFQNHGYEVKKTETVEPEALKQQ